MHDTISCHLAQARIADLRHHAQRESLARAARRARPGRPGDAGPGWPGPPARRGQPGAGTPGPPWTAGCGVNLRLGPRLRSPR